MSANHLAIWGAWYGSGNTGDRSVLLNPLQMPASEIPGLRLTVTVNGCRN